MLARWTAFSFFVCAAFAVPVPFVDRSGLAALGLAFVALSLGGRLAGVAAVENTTQLEPAEDIATAIPTDLEGVIEFLNASQRA